MGNYRFKLSDMIPNAWFYKLKDMGKNRNHPMNKKLHPPSTPPSRHHSYPRQSYYYSSSDHPNLDKFNTSPNNPKASDTHLPPDPPRKSKKRTKRRNSRSSPKLGTSSVSAGCSCRATLESVWKPESSSTTPDSPPLLFANYTSALPSYDTVPEVSDQFNSIATWSSTCSCRVSSSATDIIIDVDDEKSAIQRRFEGFNPVSDLELPPILTKPSKFKKQTEPPITGLELEEKISRRSLSVKVLKEGSLKNTKEDNIPARRSTSSIQGLKLRTNSPRLASKKIQAYNNRKSTSLSASTNQKMRRRKSVSESFAVVKSSSDPQRDFRESMVEMIVENNIRASKDLEDLLACYLSLNSNEYHDVIVKVFEQIWFNLTDIQL